MNSGEDIAIVALLTSLIALLIATGQLLQAIFGTAEGFRRTNKEIMSLFAQSRDRVFQLTELRFETRFSTPHFTFHNVLDENALLSAAKSHSAPFRSILAIGIGGSKIADLNRLVRSSARISKLQRFLNLLDRNSAFSNSQLVLPEAQGYAASWLFLLEQLYVHDEHFHQNDKTACYVYVRRDGKSSKPGPDRKQVRYPAIESHIRSWDLLPPDVVRPLASISLGDLLTLCYRLRINVQDYKPRSFSADGNGHSFWSLNVPGLGMVLQYRYDRLGDNRDVLYHAGEKAIPCEDTDKLAFGIIPKNKLLGIERDWSVSYGNYGQTYHNLPDAMEAHFKDLGLCETVLSKVVQGKDRKQNLAWQAFSETVLLLAPFLPIDGLGIVKCQPPIPFDWFHSILYIREGRIVLRKRLNDLLALEPRIKKTVPDWPPSIKDFPSKQLHWISHVLNFFEMKYNLAFHSVAALGGIMGRNAHGNKAQACVQELRSAYTDADNFLASMFNQSGALPTYQYIVAAHHEMAIDVQCAVKQEIREDPKIEFRQYRDDTCSPGVARWKTEIMHQYIDCCMNQTTIVDAYREKTRDLTDSLGRRPAILSDEQIRDGWFTMMLRGCLWAWTHFLFMLPNLPYPSRLWQDSTLVLIA